MSPARRTQATRRREMRARLLEATFACLVERGYAKTSTTAISERAGVSRGAQLHHFRTREDLMLAAIEHVFDQRRAHFRRAMARVPAGPDRLGRALDEMWKVVSGDATCAWLELVVAARAEPALRDKVERTTERLRRAAAEELEAIAGDSVPETALTFASALMDGLVVQQLAGLGAARADRVLGLLRQLASILPRSEGA